MLKNFKKKQSGDKLALPLVQINCQALISNGKALQSCTPEMIFFSEIDTDMRKKSLLSSTDTTINFNGSVSSIV